MISLQHRTLKVSVCSWSRIYFFKHVVLSTVPTSELAPADTEQEQLQGATNTARINSAFHSNRHVWKVMLQGVTLLHHSSAGFAN